MPPDLKLHWTVKITPAAAADRYKIVRGEAAVLGEVLALLYQSHPPGGFPYADGSMDNTYEYTQSGYRAIYEALEEERVIRVLFFELASSEA